MVGVGAAARVVASAVVSGSVGLATAHGQTVEADAQHTAAAITQELHKAPCGRTLRTSGLSSGTGSWRG
jgi:hypothetical protein